MSHESRSQRVIQSLLQDRCYACGWPLGSCRPFNCSFRPNEHSPEYAGWKQRIHEMQDVALEAHQDQPVAGLGAVTPTGDSASVQCAQGRVAPAPTNSDTSSESVAPKPPQLQAAPMPYPTKEEIAQYRDTFRRELDKRMDTKHRSWSPSTESHEIALREFVENRNAP